MNAYEKMREALEAVDDAFSCGSLYASGDCPTPHDVSVFEDVRDKVKAALAAPPRNCDRLPNRASAIEAYQKDTGFNKHPVVLWTAAQIYAFIDWLFATKKGENDAIK